MDNLLERYLTILNEQETQSQFITRNKRYIYETIVKRMLPVYNQSWNETNKKMSASEFVKHIGKMDVSYKPPYCTIYFETDLFRGHVIEVRMYKDKITDCSIAG